MLGGVCQTHLGIVQCKQPRRTCPDHRTIAHLSRQDTSCNEVQFRSPKYSKGIAPRQDRVAGSNLVLFLVENLLTKINSLDGGICRPGKHRRLEALRRLL